MEKCRVYFEERRRKEEKLKIGTMPSGENAEYSAGQGREERDA